jgi:cyclohexanecarboxyl-CoA dehydrogenase
MLSFAFSPEQEDFRAQLRKFAVAELAPHYLERAARSEFCWEAHRQLASLGVLGIGLPEKHGGTGAPDPVALGLAAETLAYGDVNIASAPVLSGLVASQLAENGQDAVVDEWLPQLVATQ